MPEPALKQPKIFPLSTDPLPDSPESRRPPRFDVEFDRLDERAAEFFLMSRPPLAGLEMLQQIASRTSDPEKRARHYMQAGQLRERLGQIEAAVDCYDDAASLTPKDAAVSYWVQNNLGYCLNRMHRHAEAEAACRRALAIDPAPFNAHKNLGVALEGLGRFGEAAESYLEAVRIGRDDAVSARRLRMLLVSHPEIGRDRPSVAAEVEALLARGRRDWPGSKPIPDEGLESRIRVLLASIEVEDPLVLANGQVFGLRWNLGAGPEYATLGEALERRQLEVTEVSDAGSVPRIRVANHDAIRILLMAGEQLVGAKQNRVLNATILMDEWSELDLPVSCVEAGRWSYRGRGFASKGSSSHYALRAMMAKKAHLFYRSRGTPESDQGEVWQEVDRKLAQHATQSPSHALDALYEKLGERLDESAAKVEPRADWCGAAFCFGGRIVGVDLFDRPETLRKQWPKLARGYALDVMDEKDEGAVSKDRLETWIRGAASSLIDFFPSPGLGVDCRLESNEHVGALLVVDGRPLHVEMFYEEEM
ncbi:MAG: ARPP-1 family domain-containing protein [Bacteroidota bacterium]